MHTEARADCRGPHGASKPVIYKYILIMYNYILSPTRHTEARADCRGPHAASKQAPKQAAAVLLA